MAAAFLNARPGLALDATPPPLLPPEEMLLRERHRGVRLWIFDVTGQAGASAVYDDNIYIKAVGHEGDLIWKLSPGVSATAEGGGEKRLTLSYTPAFNFYTRQPQNNSIDQAATFAATWPFARLTLGVSQEFQSSAGSVVDVGNRVNQTTYITSLTSKYLLSEKTSFEVNGRYTILDFENLIGSTELVNENWINYQVTPKVQLSLGFTLGHRQAQLEPTQTYEQVLMRAVYVLTGKLSLNASVGGEFRQYAGGPPSRPGLVFALGAAYAPREGTSVSLEAHRHNENSAVLRGQDYVTTGAALIVRQVLWEPWSASLSVGYDLAEYEAASTSIVATRKDNYYSVGLEIDYKITDRWQAGLFYQYRKNISSSSFGFDNNLIGLQSVYSF